MEWLILVSQYILRSHRLINHHDRWLSESSPTSIWRQKRPEPLVMLKEQDHFGTLERYLCSEMYH